MSGSNRDRFTNGMADLSHADLQKIPVVFKSLTAPHPGSLLQLSSAPAGSAGGQQHVTRAQQRLPCYSSQSERIHLVVIIVVSEAPLEAAGRTITKSINLWPWLDMAVWADVSSQINRRESPLKPDLLCECESCNRCWNCKKGNMVFVILDCSSHQKWEVLNSKRFWSLSEAADSVHSPTACYNMISDETLIFYSICWRVTAYFFSVAIVQWCLLTRVITKPWEADNAQILKENNSQTIGNQRTLSMLRHVYLTAALSYWWCEIHTH